MTVVIGPIACINCGQKVVWHKDDGMWRLRDEGGQRHKCVDSPLTKTPRKMAA